MITESALAQRRIDNPRTDLCGQIKALLTRNMTHDSCDFDSIVSNAKNLGDFHTIYSEFKNKNPKSEKLLNQRITIPLTRQEAASKCDVSFEDIAKAEKKLLTFIYNSLKNSVNPEKYKFAEEKIPTLPLAINSLPLRTKIPKNDKNSSRKDPIITAEERAAKVKSLYLELKLKKGDEYASNMLKPRDKILMFNLILKDIPINKKTAYPITGYTRSYISNILRDLEGRLKDELSI